MPNRLIKETICTSDNLNTLSPPAEVLFYRLIVICDDYGRMQASPGIIRGRCFPLRLDTVSNADVTLWLNELASAQLIKLYSVEGHSYFEMITWPKHQQIRAKRSKWPSPDTSLQSSASNCKHLLADAPVILSENPKRESNPKREGVLGENEQPQKKTTVLPDWIDKTAWESFLEMRKSLRAPPTARAQELLIKELDRLKQAGQDPNAVLNQSTVNSWKGVFAVKKESMPGEKKGGGNGEHPGNPRALPERHSYPRPESLYRDTA